MGPHRGISRGQGEEDDAARRAGDAGVPWQPGQALVFGVHDERPALADALGYERFDVQDIMYGSQSVLAEVVRLDVGQNADVGPVRRAVRFLLRNEGQGRPVKWQHQLSTTTGANDVPDAARIWKPWAARLAGGPFVWRRQTLPRRVSIYPAGCPTQQWRLSGRRPLYT